MTTVTDRDFLAEMDEAIRAIARSESYQAPLAGQALAEKLRETDPELLAGWLDLKAGVILTAEISTQRRRDRSSARHQKPRSAFGSAAERFADGDQDALDRFALEHHVIDEHETALALGAMTGAHHKFVAAKYDGDAKAARMYAAFHRAVAKKVGMQRTDEVFTVEEYRRLEQSITGKSTPEAA